MGRSSLFAIAGLGAQAQPEGEQASATAASLSLVPSSLPTAAGPWRWIPLRLCQLGEGEVGDRKGTETQSPSERHRRDCVTRVGTITSSIIDGWSQMVLFFAILCYNIISWPSHFSSQKSFKFKNATLLWHYEVHLTKRKNTGYHKGNKEI